MTLNKIWEHTSNIINGTKNKIYDYTIGAVAHNNFTGKGLKFLRQTGLDNVAHAATAIGGFYAGGEAGNFIGENWSTWVRPSIDVEQNVIEGGQIKDQNEQQLTLDQNQVVAPSQKLTKVKVFHPPSGTTTFHDFPEKNVTAENMKSGIYDVQVAKKSETAMNWDKRAWKKKKGKDFNRLHPSYEYAQRHVNAADPRKKAVYLHKMARAVKEENKKIGVIEKVMRTTNKYNPLLEAGIAMGAPDLRLNYDEKHWKTLAMLATDNLYK